MENLLKKGDCLYIWSPSNLLYFSGYENADADLLFYRGKKYYFTDHRYFEEVKNYRDLIVMDRNLFYEFLRDNFIDVLLTESDISFSTYYKLIAKGIAEIVFVTDEINAMRAIKTPEELSKIKQAQEITDKTFGMVQSHVKEGMTELALAAVLEGLLYQNGAHSLAFSSIVAFGENTSKPHAHRSERKLKQGDIITLDFGAKYRGYCSDMTRTFWFGSASERQKTHYLDVLAAQERAISELKQGMTGKACDLVAREYFREKGLDQYFLHSLGHSLGIDIHEKPTFSPKCDDPIQNGTVLSVEPGLYFKGEYGIRIEDLVYFTETGVENLTKSEKSVIIL